MSRTRKKNETHKEALQKKLGPDHKMPSSRRDFLAHGLLGMTGAILMPSIFSLMGERSPLFVGEASALAAGSCASGGLTNVMTPFLIYDLAGGANIPYGNVLVGKTNPSGAQTDFLDDTASLRLGTPAALNPKNNPQMVDNELGLLFHTNSAFLAGLRSSTSPETRVLMDGMIFCTRSMDDTSSNPLNPAYWLAAAGAKGALVDIVGNGNASAKGNSTVPAESLSVSTTANVNSARSALALVNRGLLGDILPKQEEKILKAAQSMSESRLRRFNQQALPDQLRELVECGYMKSVENMTLYTDQAIDSRADQAATAAKAVNNIGVDNRIPTAFAPVNNDAELVTTMAKLVLDGYAGVGTIQAGGYDYHGDSRQNQSIKDFRAGRNAGFCFEMARLKGKPLAMTFITDGGVGAGGGNADNSPEAAGRLQFTSDDGTKSAAFMLVFHPTTRPESTGIRQVGGFLDNSGSVDQATPIGNSPVNLTKAIALNYLALHGKEGTFDATVKGNPFGADLSRFIGFTKLKA